MTVGQLIVRLQEFDESLPVRVTDDASWHESKAIDVPIRHANLPEHESYVVLSTARAAPRGPRP